MSATLTHLHTGPIWAPAIPITSVPTGLTRTPIPFTVLTRSLSKETRLTLNAGHETPDPNPILCFASAPATTFWLPRHTNPTKSTARRQAPTNPHPPPHPTPTHPTTTIRHTRNPDKHKRFPTVSHPPQHTPNTTKPSRPARPPRSPTHAMCPSCQASKDTTNPLGNRPKRSSVTAIERRSLGVQCDRATTSATVASASGTITYRPSGTRL